MIAIQEMHDTTIHPIAKIKVLGIGGAGNNIVNEICKAHIEGIECIVANTDAQTLQKSSASKTIQLGVKLAKGLGAGANPDIGRKAAEEDIDKILEAVGDADIVFLTAGMGGGTGSGAISVIAQALKERGILTIGTVTKPFMFEGKRRGAIAEQAIEELKKHIDTLLVIPNQRLLDIADEQVSMLQAFAMVNQVLQQSIKGIAYIITKSGHINVDFADLKAIIKDMGVAVMGTGIATGENRAVQATLQAISSPLLENMHIQGARGVLINITGGPNLGLHEIHQAASVIYEQADEQANIILGSVIEESMGDELIVTVIATGFESRTVVTQAIPTYTHETTIQKAQPVIVREVPMQQAASPIEPPKAQSAAVTPAMSAPHEYSELDVPAFMRKEQQKTSQQDM